MSDADKARKTVLNIEIPRDELAVRIAERCIGMRRPANGTAAEALAQMDLVQPNMSAGFRSAADAAVLFFHECVNAGRAPN